MPGSRALLGTRELLLTPQEQLLRRLREGPELLQRKLEQISLARVRLQKSVDERWQALTAARRRLGDA